VAATNDELIKRIEALEGTKTEYDRVLASVNSLEQDLFAKLGQG
jgi:hypothetical protein